MRITLCLCWNRPFPPAVGWGCFSLVISPCMAFLPPGSTDGVNLINKNNTRCLSLALLEQITHPKLLHLQTSPVGTGYGERHLCFPATSLCQGFPVPGGPTSNTPLEFFHPGQCIFRIFQEIYHFHYLFFRLIQASYIGKKWHSPSNLWNQRGWLFDLPMLNICLQGLPVHHSPFSWWKARWLWGKQKGSK